jgi:hypothetical protein
MHRRTSTSTRRLLLLTSVVGCSSSSQSPDGSGPDGAPGDGGAIICMFAGVGDPSSLPGSREIINATSERLSAPGGGLWWIAEPLDTASVVAETDAGGSMVLEVVKREPFAPDRPLATLRVPPTLAPGARLRLATRELIVTEAVEPLDLAQVGLAYAHRSDLGGTGIAVTLPPAWRSRIFVAKAYVGLPGANVQTGIQVLEELLLADAPRLCRGTTSPDAGELFVPMWAGQLEPREELALTLVDADNFQNGRLLRQPRP